MDKIESYNLDNNSVNIINVDYKQKKTFEKISVKSRSYIEESFSIAIKLIKSNFTKKFINGPISKKYFLNNKFLGITEYITSKFKISNSAMLIYNKQLSVSPITTHLSIKNVPKKITKNLIIKNIKLLDIFFKKKLNIKPKIAITGLNPHCEGKTNEEKTLIKPAISYLRKKKIKIFGPFPAKQIARWVIKGCFPLCTQVYFSNIHDESDEINETRSEDWRSLASLTFQNQSGLDTWHFIDSSNRKQGPFSTLQMISWCENNNDVLLSLNTMIRRDFGIRDEKNKRSEEWMSLGGRTLRVLYRGGGGGMVL